MIIVFMIIVITIIFVAAFSSLCLIIDYINEILY